MGDSILNFIPRILIGTILQHSGSELKKFALEKLTHWGKNHIYMCVCVCIYIYIYIYEYIYHNYDIYTGFPKK